MIEDLLEKQKELLKEVPHDVNKLTARRMVSGLGVIEETLEYLNSTGHKPWRPAPLSREAQLEEITDILFFYLELIILGGFAWSEIEGEYARKWEINIDRYRRGKEGNFGWDLRGKKEEL